MTKWPTTSVSDLEEATFELRLFAPACTLVICFRDPASVALSLAGRYGEWSAERAFAEAETQRRVTQGWLSYAQGHRGRVAPIPLEDFAANPEPFVRQILRIRPTHPLPVPIVRSEQTGLPTPKHSLPDPVMHEERRHQQAHMAVYAVGRDDWMHEADPHMLPTLREIRATFGSSPSFEAAHNGDLRTGDFSHNRRA